MTTPHKKHSTITRKSLPLQILLLLAVLSVVGLFLGGLLRVKYPPVAYDRVDIREGVVLPNLSFLKLSGDVDSLAEMDHKVIFINFWASWCEACLEEMPSISALRDAHKAQGMEVLGINLDDSPAEIVPLIIQKYRIEFPVYVDPEGKIADFFDIHAIPRSIIIGRNKEILLIKDGQEEWDSDEMHEQMNRWLAI